MAREKQHENPNEPSPPVEEPTRIDASEDLTYVGPSEDPTHVDVSAGANCIEVTCPQCESRWTCDDPADPTCPDCETSFSVRVRDGFALVERRGWAVAVSLATPDWQGVVGDG